MFNLTPHKRGGISKTPGIFNFDSMLERFFDDDFFPMNNIDQMKVDIKENEKEYIVEAELPGYSKDEVKVELVDDRLNIRVEKNEEIKEETDNYLRRERKFGSQGRSFYVDNVKVEDVKAKFENGVLTINLPKLENRENKGRNIEIE